MTSDRWIYQWNNCDQLKRVPMQYKFYEVLARRLDCDVADRGCKYTLGTIDVDHDGNVTIINCDDEIINDEFMWKILPVSWSKH